ncbi:MAG: arginine decarboxylase, partial [Bacteroidota bacterium]
MNNRYVDLIDQTFYFPQEGFDIDSNGYLEFNGVPLKYLIEKYGTPFKVFYLPKIGEQIKKAKNLFTRAIKASGYTGRYYYSYCTKSNHFSHVLEEVLQHDVQLETSSAFDLDLIQRLAARNLINPENYIICNGFKPEHYKRRIVELINTSFDNLIPVCDNVEELNYYANNFTKKCKIGLRVATEEEPNFEFYTSRLGIRNSEVIPLYKEKIADNPLFELKMLHFFVDTGIKDTLYYWGELKKALKVYCSLRKLCPTLNAINIG